MSPDAEAIERRWGVPTTIVQAILARRFAVAACDARAIGRRFLPFAPDMAGFFAAAHAGIGELRRADRIDGVIRFDPVASPAIDAPADRDWYMLRTLSDTPEGARVDRDFCADLGKDDQADITAYAHGIGVHAPRHTDLSGGIVVMLAGDRQWRAEPPSVRGDGIFSPLSSAAWGDGFAATAPVVDTDVDTIIYIPSGWWHETRSLTPSLTVRIGIAERTVARPHQTMAT